MVFISNDDPRLRQDLREKYADTDCIFIDKEKILEEISEIRNNEAVIVLPNSDLKKISEDLYKLGIYKVSVFPIDLFQGVNDGKIIEINNKNPRLSRLELEVTPQCNLKCKGCTHYCNLTSDEDNIDFEKYKSSLIRLKQLFWGVHLLRLMGGEPLMNPDYLRFVKTAREIFPDANIQLVSNGLLILKLTSEELNEIKKNRCSFAISYYPPLKKKLKEIKDILDKHGVEYDISPPIKFFFKTLVDIPHESSERSFKQCMFSQCHSMLDGELSICGLSIYSYRINREFDLNIPSEDKIDIFSTKKTGWEIEQMFKVPHDMCRYCHTAMVPFRWSTRPRFKAVKEDYLVENNTLNMVVLPNIQRLAMPVLKRMYALYGKMRQY